MNPIHHTTQICTKTAYKPMAGASFTMTKKVAFLQDAYATLLCDEILLYKKVS